MISGRVQGVGYRWSLQQKAQRERVRGWTRNRSDGRVEAVLVGSPESLEIVMAWCKAGPPEARVSAIEVEWQETGLWDSFTILPTHVSSEP